MAVIDFCMPTLTPEGWRVKVHKTTLRGKTYIQSMVFEDKDDAFRFHEHIRQIWLNQRQRGA